MLYLVYVLTFLAGILFYVMSPRDDQVNLDVYRAEGFIASFLAQHQAAKDYLTQWLGFNLPNQNLFNLVKKINPGDLNYEFEKFFPRMVISDVSEHQASTLANQYQNIEKATPNDDWQYQTSVFCFDSTDNPMSCNNPNARRYLVTYSGMERPDWWPKEGSSRQRRYETWRNALVRRTNGSYNCGVLVWTDHELCVDNGQTVRLKTGACAQRVPPVVADALGCAEPKCLDAFFCISRVKQGPNSYYTNGLTAFYDGINNQNTGAEGIRGPNVWFDILRQPANDFRVTGGDTMDAGVLLASVNGVSFPRLNIVNLGDGLYHNFTLTFLIEGGLVGGDPNTDQDISILLDTGGYLEVELTQAGSDETAELKFLYNNGASPTWLTVDTGVNIRQEVDALNNTKRDRILSLTLIGYPDRIEVYANKKSIGTINQIAHDLSYSERAHIIDGGDGGNVGINSKAGAQVYIFGVRYYDSKSLTPEELERNLKMDSKRYGFSY